MQLYSDSAKETWVHNFTGRLSSRLFNCFLNISNCLKRIFFSVIFLSLVVMSWFIGPNILDGIDSSIFVRSTNTFIHTAEFIPYQLFLLMSLNRNSSILYRSCKFWDSVMLSSSRRKVEVYPKSDLKNNLQYNSPSVFAFAHLSYQIDIPYGYH